MHTMQYICKQVKYTQSIATNKTVANVCISSLNSQALTTYIFKLLTSLSLHTHTYIDLIH